MLGEHRGLTLYLLAFEPTVFLIAFVGLLGGVASFLYALNNDRYQNNKYFEKCLAESIGGLITATVLTAIFFDSFRPSLLLVAFSIGLVWGLIVQAVRSAITRHVVEFLEDG